MTSSPWTKQRNDERKANNPFKEGMSVAVINYHSGRRVAGQRKVAKVHKNGNVVLFAHDGAVSDKQWKPNQTGTHADPVGEKYAREHIEPWTAEIANEKRAAELANDLQRRANAALRHLMNARLTLEQVVALEQIVTKGE